MSWRRVSGTVPAAIVALAAVAVFLPSLANGFAYDDVPLIPGDPRIHSIAGFRDVFLRPYWPGAGTELALYRPLTTLSFAADWTVSGGSASWFHVTNMVWHAMASVLAFLLLRSLFPAPGALLGALLFAVHPVHVEAVANVVGRGELLAGVFFLGACLLWVREEGERPGTRFVATIVALYAAALLSKEGAATLPAVLVLLDAALGRWRLEDGALRTYLRGRVAALGAMMAVLAGFLVLRTAVVGVGTPSLVHPAAEVLGGPLEALQTALQAWPVYVQLLFAPTRLLADYGPQIVMPATGWTPAAMLGSIVLLGGVGAGIAALVSGRGRIALALLWFPVTILPVSNLLFTTGVLVAERTLYLPSLALSIAVAGVVAAIPASAPRPGRAALGLAFASVLILLAGRSWTRVPDWRSTDAIFEALLRDAPHSYRAHWYFGRARRAAGDLDAAQASYDEAIRLWPHRRALVLEAAGVAIQRQDLRRARSLALAATEQWPGSIETQRLLAAVSLDLGDTLTADVAIRRGLLIDPSDAMLGSMARSIRILEHKAHDDRH